MIVKRVENKSGEGPYQGIEMDEWVLSNHGDNNHPNRFEDRFSTYLLEKRCKVNLLLKDNYSNIDDYYFGFELKRNLNNWFSKKELKNLKGLGFHVVKYEISTKYVLQGKSKKQIMFLKSKAIKLGETK